MSETCPNCGNPVLESDTACWHCGYALPKRPRARPAPAATRAREAAQSPTPDYDLRALAIYGLLTLAVVAALLLVMAALGRQPILVRSGGLRLGDDWLSVTDAELRYTLSLPSDWQWVDAAYRDQADLLREVIARQPYIARALEPLGRPARDVEIVAAVVGAPTLDSTEPQPLVVVGRSAALAELSPDEALAALAAQGLSATDQSVDRHLAGRPQARFTILDSPYQYQCRHLFTSGPDAGYLVAACAPQSRYGTDRHLLDDILGSFQLLER